MLQDDWRGMFCWPEKTPTYPKYLFSVRNPFIFVLWCTIGCVPGVCWNFCWGFLRWNQWLSPDHFRPAISGRGMYVDWVRLISHDKWPTLDCLLGTGCPSCPGCEQMLVTVYYVVRGKEDNPQAIGCVWVSQRNFVFFFHSTKIPEKNELTDYSGGTPKEFCFDNFHSQKCCLGTS